MTELAIIFSLAVLANYIAWQHPLFKWLRPKILKLIPAKYAEFVERGLACPTCVGFWVGAAAGVVAYFLGHSGQHAILWPLLVSGAAYLYAK